MPFGSIISAVAAGGTPAATAAEGAAGDPWAIEDPRGGSVIARLLSPDPARRYRRAADAVAELDPPVQRRSGGPMRMGVAALIAATAMTLVAVPVYLRWT